MKKTIMYFLNRPLLVTVVSLVIASTVAWQVHTQVNAAPVVQYVKVTSGAITTSGDSAGAGTHLTLGFLTGGTITAVQAHIGDLVHKGDVLASLDPGNTQGALTQAKAALAAANAAYDKLIHGATGSTVDVAQTAVDSAKTALQQTTAQQDLAVQNAYEALLNVTPTAYPEDTTYISETPPTISGSYTLGKEGIIVVHTYSSNSLNLLSFDANGLATTTHAAMTATPQALGNSGLYIQFPANAKPNRTWIISLPNTKASNYVAMLNAYKFAKQTRDQALAAAQAKLDQANANLALVVAKARPEDVAAAAAHVESAKGALQIAQAAYNNTLITAPADGTVSAVHITTGQLAIPNAPAIELSENTTTKQVAVLVPDSAVIMQDGKPYVMVMTEHGPKQQPVTTGVSDSRNTEITSGLSVGQMVALQD